MGQRQFDFGAKGETGKFYRISITNDGYDKFSFALPHLLFKMQRTSAEGNHIRIHPRGYGIKIQCMESVDNFWSDKYYKWL